MIREAKIYIGDASKFNPENYYTIPGVTVNDDGEVFNSSGEKMKTEAREGYKYVRVMINGKAYALDPYLTPYVMEETYYVRLYPPFMN